MFACRNLGREKCWQCMETNSNINKFSYAPTNNHLCTLTLPHIFILLYIQKVHHSSPPLPLSRCISEHVIFVNMTNKLKVYVINCFGIL